MEEYTRLLHPKYQKMIEKRVEAVRNAIGDDVDIIAECHSRLDAQSAVQVAKIMEKYNILYFEEPTIPNHDLMKYVSSHTTLPWPPASGSIRAGSIVPTLKMGPSRLSSLTSETAAV